MKSVCAALALSVGCGVASAQYIIDTFTSDMLVTGNSGSLPAAPTASGPTNSTAPTDSGVRWASASGVLAWELALVTSNAGSGEWNMNWLLDTHGWDDGVPAQASLLLQWNYAGLDLGSMTTLSARANGNRIQRVLPGEDDTGGTGIPADRHPTLTVILTDTSGRSAGWIFQPYFPTLVNYPAGTPIDPIDIDWALDLTSTPTAGEAGIDLHSIASLSIQHDFYLGGSTRSHGNMSYTELAFIPAPGAGVLLGLGGLAAVRRRR